MTPLALAVEGRPLRVLCIGAHSDDIEIGAGATILSLATRGGEVSFDWVVLSAVGARAEEAAKGAALFAPGAGVQLEAFPDGRFPMHLDELKTLLAGIGERVEPDIILTHAEHDRHQDHRTVNDLVWQTFRDHLILGFEIPKFDGDLLTPNVYVEVDRSTADAKVRHLAEAFGSQTEKPWFDDETFLGLMRLRGIEARADSGLAEGFHMRKALLA